MRPARAAAPGSGARHREPVARRARRDALTGGYTLAWEIGALVVVAGAAAALALLRPPRAREAEVVAAADAA